MNTLLWVAAVALGVWLAMAASDLSTVAYRRRGEPYGFGSQRAFRLSYLALGAVMAVAGALELLFSLNLNPLGVVFIAGGTEICLRSRELGNEFWEKARRYPEVAKYHRGALLTGACAIVMGVAMLLLG